MSNQILPQITIFTMQEAYQLALLEALRRAGIQDPAAFVASNNVVSLASTRLDAEAMVIAIVSAEPKKPEPAQAQK